MRKTVTETITAHVLDAIAFQPDLPALMKRLHIRSDSADALEFRRLVDQAVPLARPRALLMEAYVTDRGEDWVEIEGKRFHSRVLQVNLAQARRVFPFLITCGQEMQAWSDELKKACDDMLLSYWAEVIKEAALQDAIAALVQRLVQIHPGKTAMMNPGSLADWPLAQQQVLFDLFGSHKEAVGVLLTDSLLMVPNKSVSGIHYPTEIDFASCQLCPREACPNRRAPYDPHLYADRYGAVDGVDRSNRNC